MELKKNINKQLKPQETIQIMFSNVLYEVFSLRMLLLKHLHKLCVKEL